MFIIINNWLIIFSDFNLPNEIPENVALRKPTQQSSTAQFDFPSFKAVDGLTHTISHTDLNVSPYLWVDLEIIYNIIRIEIINRADYGMFIMLTK